MGKRSTRTNKNIYQIARENLDLTRSKASEKMDFISADRIEKIESEKSLPHPDEILTMAKAYKFPGLCNYYCSHECPIGEQYVPELQPKELSQIVLEMLASLNALDKVKNRFIEITVDGKITEDEYEDFADIQDELRNISLSASTLQLWIDQMIADGQIDGEKLEAARKSK